MRHGNEMIKNGGFAVHKQDTSPRGTGVSGTNCSPPSKHRNNKQPRLNNHALDEIADSNDQLRCAFICLRSKHPAVHLSHGSAVPYPSQLHTPIAKVELSTLPSMLLLPTEDLRSLDPFQVDDGCRALTPRLHQNHGKIQSSRGTELRLRRPSLHRSKAYRASVVAL
jgi:hypothetical protein